MPKKLFNDATDHLNRHVGGTGNRVELKKLPKPVRFVGYFMIGCSALAVILILVGLIVTYS